MKVENALHPTEEQMAGFAADDHGKPIYMVNAVKFREKAEYPDGRASDISGAEAWSLYVEGTRPHIEAMGGGIAFMGDIERLLIGDVEEMWDQIVIVNFPSRSAMAEFVTSETYAEILPHRLAGLAGQLNIETTKPPAA